MDTNASFNTSQEVFDYINNNKSIDLTFLFEITEKQIKENPNDSLAMNNLGFLHKNIHKDNIKAEEWLLKGASLKNSYAMNNLATFYFKVYKDYIKAEEWLLKSASSGYSGAITNLLYLYDKCIDPDYDLLDKLKDKFNESQMQEYNKLKEKHIKHVYNDIFKDDCNICYNKLYIKSVVVVSCGHVFHYKCIQKLDNNKKNCPMCSRTIQ
jgi:hypothetical protein